MSHGTVAGPRSGQRTTPPLTQLRRAGWTRVFVAYAFSRMSAGTAGLALLLIGQRVHHSLALGALADTGYAVAAAITAPFIARLADRRGPRLVLPASAILYASALTAIFFVAARGPAWFVASAALAGAAMPPLGATFRSTLTEALPDQSLRSAALTVESVLVEALQVTGPALVTGCVAVASPQLALLLIAAAVLGGTVALTPHPALRARPVARSDGSGRLFTSALLRMIGLWMIFTGSLSALIVLSLDYAGPSRVWLGGLCVAVLAGGSIVGGLTVANRPLPGPPARQLTGLLVAMAVAVSLLAVVRQPALYVATVAVAALGVAPSMGLIMTMLGDAVPPHRRTEAFGWMTSANYLGGALWSAAAAGLVLVGQPATAALVGLSLLLAAGVVLAGARVHRPVIVLPDPAPDASRPRVLASVSPEGGTP